MLYDVHCSSGGAADQFGPDHDGRSGVRVDGADAACLLNKECSETDEAIYHRQECNLLLCDDCTTHHHKTKLCNHHTLQPIEELKERKQAQFVEFGERFLYSWAG